MAKEMCLSMEGSRSERNMFISSSANPSSESKQTSNKVHIQTKVGDVQVASSKAKKMAKLIQSKQMFIKSPKQVGSPQKPCHYVS
jgi:hypothetical protein